MIYLRLLNVNQFKVKFVFSILRHCKLTEHLKYLHKTADLFIFFIVSPLRINEKWEFVPI